MRISKAFSIGLLASVFAVGFAAQASATATTYGSFSAWSVATTLSGQTTAEGGVDGDIDTSITGLLFGSSLTDISPALTRATVGPTWGTWQGQPGSDGTTVWWAPDFNTITANFNPGVISGHTVDAFGFYAEPDAFSTLNITMALSDGSSLTEAVDGSGGASFFGWVGSGVTSITLSTTDSDFAFGDFFEGFSPSAETSVPEPLTLSLFGAGLAGAALLRRRKSKKA